jgi:hypothetical protein
MTFVRVYLLALGIFSVVIGLAYVLRPVQMASLGDLVLPSPLATIEIQGFYGGQLVGVGLGILLGVWNRRLIVPALMLAAVPLAGTALGRLYGVIAAGTCPPAIAALFVVEVAAAGMGGLLLRRELAPGV